MRSANVTLRAAVTTGALLVLAGSAAASDGEGGLYFGDLGQAIAAVIIFAALLVVLGRWAWKPIITNLKRREEQVSHSIDAARKRQTEADQLAEEYKQRMAQAEKEAQQLLKDMRTSTEADRQAILDRAQSEARGIIEDARTQIADARDEALHELQQTTAELAAQIARQVLAVDLSQQQHQELIDHSLAQAGEHLSGGN